MLAMKLPRPSSDWLLATRVTNPLLTIALDEPHVLRLMLLSRILLNTHGSRHRYVRTLLTPSRRHSEGMLNLVLIWLYILAGCVKGYIPNGGQVIALYALTMLVEGACGWSTGVSYSLDRLVNSYHKAGLSGLSLSR